MGNVRLQNSCLEGHGIFRRPESPKTTGTLVAGTRRAGRHQSLTVSPEDLPCQLLSVHVWHDSAPTVRHTDPSAPHHLSARCGSGWSWDVDRQRHWPQVGRRAQASSFQVSYEDETRKDTR